jgi:predicted deacylase
MKTVELKDINLKSKIKRKDYFRIPLMELIDGSQISLPCAIIGKGGGKVVTVVSGQHGNEWTGTYASHLLFRKLNPDDFNGLLVMLPIANPLAFRQKHRVSTIDFVDMNRVFKFVKKNKPTDHIAKVIFNDFCLNSDILIDLHGGGPGEYLPIVEVLKEEDVDLGLSLNLKNVIILKKDSGCIVSNCEGHNIKSVSVEAGKELSIDENNAEIVSSGIINLLSKYKILNKPPATLKNQTIFNKKTVVPANKTGFFTAIKSLGDNVIKGQTIGKIQPFFVGRPSLIRSPVNGKLIYLRSQRIISEGENVAHIVNFQ